MNKMIEEQYNKGNIPFKNLLIFYLRNAPLDYDFLRKCKNSNDWEQFSQNPNIPWSVELIHQFEDRWDWKHLSANASLPWSRQLIDTFISKWDWMRLSRNQYLPWSEDFILIYWDKWIKSSLYENSSLKWNMAFIKRHFGVNDFVPMHHLPLPLIKSILEKGLIDNYPFSCEILETPDFIEIQMKYRVPGGGGYAGYGSSNSKDIFKPVDDFEQRILEVENENRFIYTWGGTAMAHYPGAPWTLELIRKYRDKLDFTGDGFGTPFCSYRGLIWTEEIIDFYINEWNWKKLSANPAMPWSLDFIKKYHKNLHWDALLTLITGAGENVHHKNILSLFRTKTDWKGLGKFITEQGKDNNILSWKDDVEWEDVPEKVRMGVGKKEFTAPVWDALPGKSLGPFYLGMTDEEVKKLAGEAGIKDSMDGLFYYYHGHLQLKFDENQCVSRIIVDRSGNGRCPAEGYQINEIYQFKVRFEDRFPFDEYHSYLSNSFSNYMDRILGSDNREKDWNDNYITYYYPQGLSVTYCYKDYKKNPVTELEIVPFPYY